MMPDLPSPYNLRDWKKVAINYDSFIYNEMSTGQYLPLVSYNNSGINYPNEKRISLHSYVGTNSPQNSEAINVMPSIVGAALVGTDIRTLYGRDRLVMVQDFFNKTNGENIYLNNSSAHSGGDWWYDVMPNIYFYQLYDLFSDFNAEAPTQFNTIASRFQEAVETMGGSATPWSPAFMNYRSWDFISMEPNENGVKEPEAAGTFAWILYHAYKVTGDKAFLRSTEWSIEFFNNLTSNPSYELQLPYGTYVAAKMNAEIATNYDIEKMVNWSFDRGPLRGWGTIVGNWGGFDVSGLVGEANDGGNDYAFLMNGMQQAAALVPMVRYDKRFARDIGKWMVNLSNASRLFYPGFLLSSQQDNWEWAEVNDPNKVIAHESMREKYQGISPYSTGDALGGGWAETNLAIYGSSSVGYLGAIVSATNVDKILQINLNVTDFFADESYPSYLYYNPYDTPKAILLELGTTIFDIYEILSEKFIEEGVTGTVSIIVPPKEAVVAVLTPPGGEITYDKNKLLIDNVVVDYAQTENDYTHNPRIQALATENSDVENGKSISIYCKAEDKDSEQLTYIWSTNNGEIIGNSNEVIWNAPQSTGEALIFVTVSDDEGNMDSDSLSITIVSEINKAPEIENISSSSNGINEGEVVVIECEASDENGDDLEYDWNAAEGIISGEGSTIEWQAPDAEGIYTIEVIVSDDKGLSTVGVISILVKKFTGAGEIIARYPFNGNANDKSGNELHGSLKGVVPTEDMDGNPGSAYYFNGGSQHIEVANQVKLNFEDAISVSLWFKAPLTSENEQFLVSHGSWQNRWKLSITPSNNIRWTINTSTSIADLDNSFTLLADQFYHVVTTYDGSSLLVYIDGVLNTFSNHSGSIKTTDFPLLIGQMLPGESNYNFKGVIDEVIIYDYALSPDDVNELFTNGTTGTKQLETDFEVSVYPNPVNEVLNLNMPLDNNNERKIIITITDLSGREVLNSYKAHQGRTIDVTSLRTGLYFLTIKSHKGKKLKELKFIKS
jgi:hypothetical protein